jgi:hypothetical protein
MATQMQIVFKTASGKHALPWETDDKLGSMTEQERVDFAADRTRSILSGGGTIDIPSDDATVRCIPHHAVEWVEYRFREHAG